MVRRREFVVVAAGLFWPAATLASAARCWVNRPVRPSLPGRLTGWGSWPLGWGECGSPVPGGLARRASVRRARRMRSMVTSWWAGPGGAAGRRGWLRRGWWRHCSPHVAGHWTACRGARGVRGGGPGGGPAALRTPGTDGRLWLAGGVPGMRWGQVLRQGAGQRVEQVMAGAEVGRGGPDVPAGDELDSGDEEDQRSRSRRMRSGRSVPRARRTSVRPCPSRDRARSARAAGSRRFAVRGSVLCAASCQGRPCRCRTGCR